MKTKNILIALLAVIIVISILTTVFKREYKNLVIKDIDTITFNDSIIYVSYYKDDNGSGIETRIKNRDTAYCFSGYSSILNLPYPAYAQKGDVIIKNKNSDSFYIKRNDTTYGFILVRCQ